MITVRLMGGLGNQMFQFAAGRALALRRGVPLRLDLGWFADQPPQDTPRAYELHVFALDDEVDKAVVPLPEPRTRLQLARARLADALRRSPNVIRQRGPGFDPAVLDAPDGAHLVGYWQSERYFADAAAVLRGHDFQPRAPLGADAARIRDEIAAAPGAVSVHVRRGDYLTNPHAQRYHGVLGVDYYARAVEIVAQRAAQPRLFVFSDDPDWCAANLDLGVPATIVGPGEGRAAWEDMLLMSACRHHVIANSSFSWWGAWLAPGDDAVVVAPERWVLDPSDDFSAVYAAGWVRA
ncbi:MAG TPA: alpha-1,2-fucosyltransferase [Capillimicrobium sp.]|nr:alpha-1,2-fucosyltransferase [Capillimicrobium sp.]